MRTPTLVSGLAFALLLAACGGSPYTVRSAIEREADYTRYRTFGLNEETLAVEGVDPERVQAAATRIRGHLVREMTSRGYEEVAATEAELVVEFAIVGNVRTASIPTSPWGGPPEELDVVEGALAVWVGDRVAGSLLWTGYLNGEWYGDGQDRSEQVVSLVMAEFPGRR